jgi:predicted Fe-Mo cluster-binding NifX family protein
MNKKILAAALVIIPKKLQQKAIAKAFNFLFADQYKQFSGIETLELRIEDPSKSWLLHLGEKESTPQKGDGEVNVLVSTTLDTLITCQRKPNLIKALDERLIKIKGSTQDVQRVEEVLRHIEQDKLEHLIDRAYQFLRITRPARLNIHDVTIEDIQTPRDIEFLRDQAIALEQTNIQLALKLMELAHQARPNGPLINKKLKQYRTAVRSQG